MVALQPTTDDTDTPPARLRLRYAVYDFVSRSPQHTLRTIVAWLDAEHPGLIDEYLVEERDSVTVRMVGDMLRDRKGGDKRRARNRPDWDTVVRGSVFDESIAVSKDGDRKRFGSMVAADCRFVAGQYGESAAESLWYRDRYLEIGRRLQRRGRGVTVEEVYSAGELAELMQRPEDQK